MMIMADLGIALITIAIITSLTMGIKVYAHRQETKQEKPKIESFKQSIKKIQDQNIDDIPDWKICKLESAAEHIKNKLRCKKHAAA